MGGRKRDFFFPSLCFLPGAGDSSPPPPLIARAHTHSTTPTRQGGTLPLTQHSAHFAPTIAMARVAFLLLLLLTSLAAARPAPPPAHAGRDRAQHGGGSGATTAKHAAPAPAPAATALAPSPRVTLADLAVRPAAAAAPAAMLAGGAFDAGGPGGALARVAAALGAVGPGDRLPAPPRTDPLNAARGMANDLAAVAGR